MPTSQTLPSTLVPQLPNQLSLEERLDQLEALEEMERSLGWKLFSQQLEDLRRQALRMVLEAEEVHLLSRLQGEARALSKVSELLQGLKSTLNVRR